MIRDLFDKIILKSRIEADFYLIQKLGWKRPRSGEIIPKYILKRLLPQNPVIIDCGAHVGADSLELSRMFPEGTVHAFEPVPHIYNMLQHTIRKRKNIRTHQLALSSSNGTASMYISSGDSDASSSLNKPAAHLEDHAGVKFESAIEVQTVTLDDWAAAENINRVDFLWLDMQGHELEMLKASRKILPTVKAIHTEVSMKQTYEGVTTYDAYSKWLTEAGFELYKEAIPANIDMGNALFVRK